MSVSRFLRPLMMAGLGMTSLAAIAPAQAHFQMLIPSTDMVTSPRERQIHLDVKFWHPFEGHGMNMDMPVRFGVHAHGRNTDLLKKLKPHAYKDSNADNRNGFEINYDLAKPGDYVFYIEPKPYWEPAEEKFIVHYTKVVVDNLGLEEGWDEPVGLKAEIIPLTRPYGLYTGNVFQGIVKVDGKPTPFTDVEVEYYNETGKLKAPADPMITQVVKTDANGVFTYAMPRAGWWGFAALNTGDKKMVHEGKDYPVEIGALMWVRTRDMGR